LQPQAMQMERIAAVATAAESSQFPPLHRQEAI